MSNPGHAIPKPYAYTKTPTEAGPDCEWWTVIGPRHSHIARKAARAARLLWRNGLWISCRGALEMCYRVGVRQ